jgi:hypothetical protein
MFHLAQVKQKDNEGKVRLKLLAQQKAEHAWSLLPADDLEIWVETPDFEVGAMVLVELTTNRQVQQVLDATPWVLELVEEYLVTGISPAILQEEMQRAEQWRQSLTLQSQELGRRSLEMEARRDQIQELEANLKLEQERLEQAAEQLKGREKVAD